MRSDSSGWISSTARRFSFRPSMAVMKHDTASATLTATPLSSKLRWMTVAGTPARSSRSEARLQDLQARARVGGCTRGDHAISVTLLSTRIRACEHDDRRATARDTPGQCYTASERERTPTRAHEHSSKRAQQASR